MPSILVVEDEKHLADGLRFNLEAEGHTVECVMTGEEALKALLDTSTRFDAVLLDVMLPGRSGFEVAAELRKRGQYVPILMLTARGRADDVLQGFAAGADDYLPKPFELKILIARVESLLRRAQWARASTALGSGAPHSGALSHPVTGAQPEAGRARDLRRGQQTSVDENPIDRETRNASRETDSFTFANKTIDFRALELRVEEPAAPQGKSPSKPRATEGRAARVHLTVMEAELLRYLVRHAGTPVSRKAILEDVWQLHEDTDTRAIDNFIARLRKYIEDEPAEPKHLLTVRGVGYKFLPDGG